MLLYVGIVYLKMYFVGLVCKKTTEITLVRPADKSVLNKVFIFFHKKMIQLHTTITDVKKSSIFLCYGLVFL